MRLSRWTVVILGAAVVVVAGGCGKSRPARHSPAQGERSAVMVPTPDNTPVGVLRTPAGLVLKTGPEATPTPSAAGAGAVPTKAGP